MGVAVGVGVELEWVTVLEHKGLQFFHFPSSWDGIKETKKKKILKKLPQNTFNSATFEKTIIWVQVNLFLVKTQAFPASQDVIKSMSLEGN